MNTASLAVIVLAFLWNRATTTVPSSTAPSPHPSSAIYAEPTMFPTPTHETPTPTATPLPTRVPTRVPTPTASLPVPTPPDLFALTQRIADEYKVDAHILRHIAQCESGFNPAATNRLYGGLYQFSASTWSSYRLRMGRDPNPALRFDAEEALRTAAYVMQLGKSGIWPNCVP